MNKVILVGRLTADPEMRYTTGENASANARFTLAVDRKFKNADGKYDTDFIRCVAWKHNAEFVEKDVHKGNKIIAEGWIRTGSYTNKDNQKVYTTEVWVDGIEFFETKGSGQQNVASKTTTRRRPSSDDFMNIPDNANEDEGLPF